jgi:hypothetical protein
MMSFLGHFVTLPLTTKSFGRFVDDWLASQVMTLVSAPRASWYSMRMKR